MASPSTLASSGVMVAHLIPTLYFWIACAQSTVTGKTHSEREGWRGEIEREGGRKRNEGESE